MTHLTVEDRFAIYQAITFATLAAEVVLLTTDITKLSMPHEARAAYWRVREEAYYAAAFAWDALYGSFALDIERDAIDAGFAAAAALDAFKIAIDDLDPQLIPRTAADFETVSMMDVRLRAQHEDIYQRYIEAYNYEGAVFDEDYVEAGVLLPDEAGLKALYQDFTEDFPNQFDAPPLPLQSAAAEIHVRMKGDHRYERSAAMLARNAAPNKGIEGECRYCHNSFNQQRESINQGVCHVCDKIYTVCMLEQQGYIVLGYDPFTGEAFIGDSHSNN